MIFMIYWLVTSCDLGAILGADVLLLFLFLLHLLFKLLLLK